MTLGFHATLQMAFNISCLSSYFLLHLPLFFPSPLYSPIAVLMHPSITVCSISLFQGDLSVPL